MDTSPAANPRQLDSGMGVAVRCTHLQKKSPMLCAGRPGGTLRITRPAPGRCPGDAPLVSGLLMPWLPWSLLAALLRPLRATWCQASESASSSSLGAGNLNPSS